MEEALINETGKLLPYFLKHKNVWANYDDVGDVLYLHFKKPNHADHSEMTEDEVIVRYENNEVIGLSILNASRRAILNMDKS